MRRRHGAWVTVMLPTGDLFAPDAGLDNEARLDDGTARLTLLARRLLAGLLLTLDSTAAFSSKDRSRSASGGSGRDDPKHRVFQCGRPITVDCRPAIRAFLCGSKAGAPASVQTLVRGHYKRQVIGVSRTGRKVIWIEPYWRGPEDAPILARPLKVGPPDPKPGMG